MAPLVKKVSDPWHRSRAVASAGAVVPGPSFEIGAPPFHV